MRLRLRHSRCRVSHGTPAQLLTLSVSLLAAATLPLRAAQPGFSNGALPAQVVERATPRVTGNPLAQMWRPQDYGAAPGNNSVILHPGSGCIYIGNDEGVLEYDGARWRLQALPKGGGVLALAVDAAGRVWLAGENEIARLEPDAIGILKPITILADLPAGESGALQRAIATPAGVWFAGRQHILRIDPAGRTSAWRTDERFGSMWWMDGAMHASLSDREVVRLEENGGWRPVVSRAMLRVPPQRASPFQVFGARETRAGEWVLLTALGPVRWNSTDRTWRALVTRPPLFRDVEAVAATFLAGGRMLFLPSRGGGIVVTPEARIERLLDRMPAVMGPRVVAVAEDAASGAWVVARERIARVQLSGPLARHEVAQGPRQFLRHRGSLFVAHRDGISRHHGWPGLLPPAEGLRRDVTALASNGERLFAAAAGLAEVLEDGGAARPLSDVAITSVAAPRAAPGHLLAGDALGLWLFRTAGAEFHSIGRLANLTTGVAGLHDVGEDAIWGTTADGRVWRLDLRGGARLDAPVRLYGPAEGIPSGVPGSRIQLFELGGAIVATSAAWILRFDGPTDRFAPETRIAGVTTPDRIGAEAAAAGRDGHGWLRLGAPDRRLLRVRPDGTGGFRSEELAVPALREFAAVGLYEDQGTLWFAGNDTLVSIDLDRQPVGRAAPMAARIRRVANARGEPLWGDAGEPGRPLTVPAEPGSLRFEFAAGIQPADLLGRPVVQYRTQWLGRERDWSGWSPEPWRDFTNLPPGRHTLNVQASDLAGRVSSVAALTFSIPAPWWRTPWAWAAGVVLATATGYGWVTLRTRALRRQAAELEATIAARTEELQRMNAELTRLHRLELSEKSAARLAEEEARLEVLRYQLNPHFLYNALNSIYSLALTAPAAAADMVLRLADFCRVALDRRGEEDTTVGAEFDKLANYLEIEKVRWGDSLHATVEAADAVRRATIPPFLLLPLVENAIKYGGATSPDELHVRVTAALTPAGALDFVIANSGHWVEPDADRPVKSSGIGLTNLRQRLARHHPGAHELTIEPAHGWVIVRLRISPRPAPQLVAP